MASADANDPGYACSHADIHQLVQMEFLLFLAGGLNGLDCIRIKQYIERDQEYRHVNQGIRAIIAACGAASLATCQGSRDAAAKSAAASALCFLFMICLPFPCLCFRIISLDDCIIATHAASQKSPSVRQCQLPATEVASLRESFDTSICLDRPGLLHSQSCEVQQRSGNYQSH